MRNTRTLPAKVDGRLMIGPFTIKKFFKWIGIPILIVVFFIKHPSENLFIFSAFLISLSAIPFMEFKHGQTGFEFFKELIVYDLRLLLADFFPSLFKNKQIRFERRKFDDSILEKFTFNKKVYEIKQSTQKTV